MNAINKTFSYEGHKIINSIADLTEVFDPQVNICELKISSNISQALLSRIIKKRFLIKKSIDAEKFNAREELSSLEEIEGIEPFFNDIELWVEAFSTLTGSKELFLRLLNLEAAMCPRFHFDKLGLRFCLTYHGPSTEFIHKNYVDFSKMGHLSGGLSDDESGFILNQSKIIRTSTGNPVILKGEGFPENEGNAVIHRSPKIADGENRIFFSLDHL